MNFKSEDFTNLFAKSVSSEKLLNFSITDFGERIQKAKISFGQVPLGIYQKGLKKKRKSIFHNEEKGLEQLSQQSSFYASLRNFQQKTFLNFTQENLEQGLFFSTFTFNNYQKKMPFSFAPWQKKGKCLVSGCSGKHFYRRISHLTSSFLAGKKVAKKRLGRNLEGNGINLTYIQGKIKKPFASSYVFINDDYIFNRVAESEFISYFDAELNLNEQVLVNQAPQFHHQSRKYKLTKETGENINDKKWRKSIPPELIYNYVYLAEIRTQIKNYSSSREVSPEKAIARYADY
nr:3132_t:CDS:2 [Entrophospora candida]